MRFTALLTGRWSIALMVLPYALLWSRAADSGGVLMALMVTALVLFYFACLDEIHVRHLDEIRLGLIRQRSRIDPQDIGIAKILFGGTAKVLAIVLLFAELWVGVMGLAVLTLLWVSSMQTRRWPVKTLWAEVLVPLTALTLPLILIGWFAERGVRAGLDAPLNAAQRAEWTGVIGGLVSPGVQLATIVGAAMLAGFLLLCAIRDEPADRGEGLVTTPTMLGRGRAGLAFFAIAAAAATLAIRGAAAPLQYGDPAMFADGRMVWPWSIAVLVTILSMLGVLLSAEREEQTAVGLWGAGTIAVAIVLNLSVV